MKLLLRLLAALALVSVGTTAPAADERWSYPEQYSMSPKGVNIQTGRFMYDHVDLSIGPFAFKRSWRDGAVDGRLGVLTGFGRSPQGWTHSLASSIWGRTDGGVNYRKVHVDGQTYTYKVMADGLSAPGDGGTQGTRLYESGTQSILTDKAGNLYVFEQSAGSYNRLLKSAIYADGTTNTFSYNAAGLPSLVSSNRGYALVLQYGSGNNLAAVCGFNTTVEEVTAGATCNGARLKVAYSYNSVGTRLTGVTDVSGGVTMINYAESGNNNWGLPACITKVNSQTCIIQNFFGDQPGDAFAGWTKRDQVRKQITANGNVWRYSYEPAEDPNDVPRVPCKPVWSYAEMIDANGYATNLTYDHGLLTENVAADGTYQYRYPTGCTSGSTGTAPVTIEIRLPKPALTITPKGIHYFEYDLRGNLVRHAAFPSAALPNLENGSDWLKSDPDEARCCLNLGKPSIPVGSLVYQQSFLPDWYGAGTYGQAYVFGCGSGPDDAKRCAKPLTQTDAKGNQTDFTYDGNHGGVLTETGPAVDGVRPQTRFTYIQRQAWVKSGGGYAPTGQPVWLLATKSICRTGLASGAGCAIAGDEVRTVYDYGPDSGPNNLLLRGVIEDATGAALRTCYGYDWMGNRISETKPKAGLTACP